MWSLQPVWCTGDRLQLDLETATFLRCLLATAIWWIKYNSFLRPKLSSEKVELYILFVLRFCLRGNRNARINTKKFWSGRRFDVGQVRNQKSAIRGGGFGGLEPKKQQETGSLPKIGRVFCLWNPLKSKKKKVITQFGTDFWVTTLRILSLLKTEKRGQVCFRSMPDSIPVQKSVSEEQNMWNFLYSAFWLAGQCRFWSRLRYWCKFCRGPNGAYKNNLGYFSGYQQTCRAFLTIPYRSSRLSSLKTSILGENPVLSLASFKFSSFIASNISLKKSLSKFNTAESQGLVSSTI